MLRLAVDRTDLRGIDRIGLTLRAPVPIMGSKSVDGAVFLTNGPLTYAAATGRAGVECEPVRWALTLVECALDGTG